MRIHLIKGINILIIKANLDYERNKLRIGSK